MQVVKNLSPISQINSYKAQIFCCLENPNNRI